MKIAVLGAGASGIATARQLQKAGLPFDVLERSSGLGGNWRFEPDNPHSGVFVNTHANTSKEIMAFSDAEMPKTYPHYPHHSALLKYLRDYAEHNQLTRHIRTQTEVTRISPVQGGEGGWDVHFSPGGTERYRAVCVATGHHWAQCVPKIAGSFAGVACHAQDYKSSERFRGQRVLVVGLGASGADIAVDLSRVAGQVHVSVRRGYHVVPKIVMGRPLDHFAFEHKKSFLPAAIRRRITDKVITTLVGDPRRFGFPAATHSLRGVSPTISSELLARIAEGSVQVRPGVERFDDLNAHFSDGTSQAYDAVVYATGYHLKVPFLDPALLDPEAPFRMYKHVVHPELRNLFFLGFVQPLGAFWPVSEAQAQWVVALLNGSCSLPTQAQMKQEVATAWRQFLDTKPLSLNTYIQVEQDAYLLELHRCVQANGAGLGNAGRGSIKAAKAEAAPFTRLVWERIARAGNTSRTP